MKLIKPFFDRVVTDFLLAVSALAQAPGSVTGQVVDSLGGGIVGATVTAVAAGGKQKSVVSNASGEYSIKGLAPGKYTVKAIAQIRSL